MTEPRKASEIFFIVKNKIGDMWAISMDTECLVSELEKEVMKQAQIPEGSVIRLISQGTILASDRTLQSYGFIDGAIIYFTATRPAPAPPTKRRTQSQDSGMNGFMKGVFDMFMSNPEMYVNFMKMNPAFKEAMDKNPMLQHVLDDDDLMREHLSMATGDNFDQLARSMDSMMTTVEALPGGFQALAKSWNEFQNPILDGLRDQFRGPAAATSIGEKPDKPCEKPLPNFNNSGMFPFADPFGLGALLPQDFFQRPDIAARQDLITRQATKSILKIRETLDELKTVFNIDLVEVPGMQDLKKLVEMSPEDIKRQSAEAATASSSKQRFEVQLKQMEAMGFSDREMNLRALEASNGNVGMAIQWLSMNDNSLSDTGM